MSSRIELDADGLQPGRGLRAPLGPVMQPSLLLDEPSDVVVDAGIGGDAGLPVVTVVESSRRPWAGPDQVTLTGDT
jgi:hypothetical protein